MRNELMRAMVMMIVAMLIIPGIDAIAKWTSDSISTGQVTLARFTFQTIFLLPLLFFISGKWATKNLLLHALRGTLIAAATVMFFKSLAFLPIADAIAIFFIEPMIVTLLSVIVLGEKVGRRRLGAIAVGFIGAVVVIRPSFATVGWPVLLPVGASLCYAFYILLTRKLTAVEHPIRMQFFAGVAGMAVMGILVTAGSLADVDVLRLTRPSATEWGLLLLLGLIATLAHLLIVYAYKIAPVSLLAPFQYIEIISATILGLVIFHDFPDGTTWIGISLIVASGIYIFRRESAAGSGPRLSSS